MKAAEALIASIRSGDRQKLGRAVSLAASGAGEGRGLLDSLARNGRKAHWIGVTGPPGAGKSTLIGGLLPLFRARGEKVAVIACDPASPLSGGAFLGDRMRMGLEADLGADPGIFVRSFAARGPGADLPEAALRAAQVLDAAGFERVIFETTGAGQNDVGLAGRVDTTVVVLTPESGDGFQTLKAGLIEVADILVVNRADRPGADSLARELEEEVRARASGRRVPVLTAVATRGEGLAALVEAVAQRRAPIASGERRS